MTEQKKFLCAFCGVQCEILATVTKDGFLTAVEPRPDHPISPGAYCRRWTYYTEYLYKSDRLKYPMKRVGKRGEGKWQIISWEQAFDEIGARLREIIAKYGSEAIYVWHGTSRGNPYAGDTKFVRAIGSPAIGAPGAEI